MGERRNSAESQQSGHTSQSGSKVENNKCSLEPKIDLRKASVTKEMMEILWMLSTGTAGRVLMTILHKYDNRRGCNLGSKSRKAHSVKGMVGPIPHSTREPRGILQLR